MKTVPIIAKINVDILDIGGALFGIAINTAKRTKHQSVLNIIGLLFLGIPFPSR